MECSGIARESLADFRPRGQSIVQITVLVFDSFGNPVSRSGRWPNRPCDAHVQCHPDAGLSQPAKVGVADPPL